MKISIRVYYEDTDCGGVVYYANYLKYFERGRTEYLRTKGLELTDLLEDGITFVVVKAEANYHKPAKYGDLLKLDTRVKETTGATITFEHEIKKDGSDTPLVTGTVTLACTGEDGKPTRIPDEVKEAL